MNQKHRRVLSSPDRVHSITKETSSSPTSTDGGGINRKTSSSTNNSSWEILEKPEKTPPGTPPPPYLSQMTGTPTVGVFDESINDKLNQLDSPQMMLANPIVQTSAVPPSSAQTISAAQSNLIQKPIISMEDEEVSSDQESFIEEHGPFRSLSQLLEQENTAHLAVFLNFVLSNSNPAPLLFYLITGLYKEGSVKDMRKWSYEIHSTFLVPRAVSIFI